MTTKKNVPKKPAAKKAEPTHSTSHAPAKRKAVGTATAASILGIPVTKGNGGAKFIPNGRDRIRAEWRKYYDTLIELRERLLLQMSGLAKESAEEMTSYSLHMADSGTDNFDRDFALSLLSSDQDAVYEIEEALKRIERNTFGTCELTNKPIPRARLEAIPWTRFTVEAQAQLEREGALRQKRLASLGSVDSSGASDVEEDSDDDEKPAKEKD